MRASCLAIGEYSPSHGITNVEEDSDDSGDEGQHDDDVPIDDVTGRRSHSFVAQHRHRSFAVPYFISPISTTHDRWA
jgi:hypothetical protein